MSVRLAFSTNAYTRFDLEEACRRIADCGYQAVEVLADAPHASPMTFGEPDAARLRGLLDRLGLAVSNVNANTLFGHWSGAPPEPFFEPSLISERPDLRDARLWATMTAMETASALGARNVSITTGKPLGSMSPERAAPVLEESLKRILGRADELGLDVGVECEPGLLIETTDELLGWIGRMASARLGANLDIGHAVVGGEDPVVAIARLKGRIWNLHLEDIRGRKHYHRIPGEGDIDFRAVSDALRRIGYDRWATVELYTQSADPDRAARMSLKVLEPLFA